MEEQTRIKICGLTRLEDIDAVNELKPEYVGFVFAKSRRQITKEHAVTLRRYLDPEIQAVGVFVNELPAIVAGYLEEGVIDLAQLHGNESEEYIHSLRFRTGGELIKAFSIKTREDVEKAKKSSADYILLDHGKGGTGESFDWSLIRNMERPYFLAGGLNAENVEQAMEPMFTTRPDLERSGMGFSKGPEKNHRMHKEDKTCLTEDLVFTEASTYRKL
mgnify:CR=1 FL=1